MVGAMVVTKVPEEWRNLEPILSIQQVADLMQVHENTVKKWISGGLLKAFKAGRVVRIHRADFFKFAGVEEE